MNIQDIIKKVFVMIIKLTLESRMLKVKTEKWKVKSGSNAGKGIKTKNNLLKLVNFMLVYSNI